MSVQIAVRLPDQLVNSLDELVDSGAARSRASVIERALLRELRYQRMLQEVEILNSGIGTDQDLDALAQFSGNVALDVD
jgi:Arc/MetJ-type ribon-helix-helix transcriptional regulator